MQRTLLFLCVLWHYVSAESGDDHPCPFMTQTDTAGKMLCGDNTDCNVFTDSWGCCNGKTDDKGHTRVKCPKDTYPCRKTTMGTVQEHWKDNTDFQCRANCNALSGGELTVQMFGGDLDKYKDDGGALALCADWTDEAETSIPVWCSNPIQGNWICEGKSCACFCNNGWTGFDCESCDAETRWVKAPGICAPRTDCYEGDIEVKGVCDVGYRRRDDYNTILCPNGADSCTSELCCVALFCIEGDTTATPAEAEVCMSAVCQVDHTSGTSEDNRDNEWVLRTKKCPNSAGFPGECVNGECIPPAPPIDCEIPDWSQSECSAPCGGGSQTRVVVAAQFGGAPCPGATEGNPTGDAATERECNTEACPVDCQVSEWSECAGPQGDEDCGEGVQVLTIVQEHNEFGKPCPPLMQDCDLGPCPIDCILSPWSECSASCDGGTKTRTVVESPKHGGEECHPMLSHDCNTDPCAVDCAVSRWGACSEPCGGGSQQRSIVTEPENDGRECPELTRECNTEECEEQETTTVGWNEDGGWRVLMQGQDYYFNNRNFFGFFVAMVIMTMSAGLVTMRNPFSRN